MLEKDGAQPGGYGEQKIWRFDNGYGASVVRGPYTYGGDAGLYELALLKDDGTGVLDLEYGDVVNGDVLGYLTPEQVAAKLDEIEAL